MHAASAHPATRPPTTVRLRNNLAVGRLSTFEIDRTVTRITQRLDSHTRLAYRRTGRWTRYILAAHAPGQASLVQMLQDDAPSLLTFEQNHVRLEPPPESVLLNLPQPAVQLRIAPISWHEAQALAPAGPEPLRLLERLALEYAFWPTTPAAVAGTWQRQIAWPGLAGTQRFTLTRIDRQAGQLIAQIHVSFDGTFSGRLSERYELVGFSADLSWSLARRTAINLSATASYNYRFGRSQRTTQLKLTLSPASLRLLKPSERLATAAELQSVVEALRHFQAGRLDLAAQQARQFAQTHPTSIWQPAAAYLADTATRTLQARRPLQPARLRQLLASLLVRWQAALGSHDSESLDKSRSILQLLCRTNRPAILELLGQPQPQTRALAVFALGFATNSQDLQAIRSATQDPDPRVRAWATYALTLRLAPASQPSPQTRQPATAAPPTARPADTDVHLLRRLLQDSDAQVRLRAIQACQTLLSPDCPSLELIVQDLEGLLSDPSARVRGRAALALARLGGKSQRASLRRALEIETDPAASRAIRQAIRQLDARH